MFSFQYFKRVDFDFDCYFQQNHSWSTFMLLYLYSEMILWCVSLHIFIFTGMCLIAFLKNKLFIFYEEIETFGYISQTWKDDRLTLNKSVVILQSDELKHIWTPDIYCVNCRSQSLENGLNPKQGMIRINENGTIYLSAGYDPGRFIWYNNSLLSIKSLFY